MGSCTVQYLKVCGDGVLFRTVLKSLWGWGLVQYVPLPLDTARASRRGCPAQVARAHLCTGAGPVLGQLGSVYSLGPWVGADASTAGAYHVCIDWHTGLVAIRPRGRHAPSSSAAFSMHPQVGRAHLCTYPRCIICRPIYSLSQCFPPFYRPTSVSGLIPLFLSN